LRQFWESVTAPTAWWPAGLSGALAGWQRRVGGLVALFCGQPGFFAPRGMHEWFSAGNCTSYYVTTDLRETLGGLVDFGRTTHARGVRLGGGGVIVRPGGFASFDGAEIPTRPEQVRARGALPPGSPPIEVDGEFYWDGGLVSNTPLQYVLDYHPRRGRLPFQVDVFQARGQMPANVEDVSEREQDLRYSRRTRI